MKLKKFYFFILIFLILSGFSDAATVSITSYISDDKIIIDASGSFDQPCPGGAIIIYGTLGYPPTSYYPDLTLHREQSICSYANGEHTFLVQVTGCSEFAADQSSVDVQINPSVTINEPGGVMSSEFDVSGTVSFGMGHGLLNFYSTTDYFPDEQSTIQDGQSFSWNALHPGWAPASNYFPAGDNEHQVTVNVSACNIAKTGIYGETVASFFVSEPDDLGGGGDSQKSCPKEGSPIVGKPVNISNGNVFIKQHDFIIPGTMSINFTRYYNSKETEARGFGEYWSHSFDTRIISLSQSTYKVITPNGSRVFYNDADNDGIYESTLHNTGKSILIQNMDGTYVIEFTDGRKEEFDISGYITAKVDRNDNRISLLRGSNNELIKITGPSGREINIVNNASGRITSMTLPDGNVYTYSYPYPDLLGSVTYPDMTVKEYAYESQRLVNIKNENDKIIEKHSYDGNGRAYTSSADGTNEKLTIDYSNSTVTDSLGRVTTYTIDKTGGRSHVTSAIGPGCSECSEGDVSYTYDEYLNITSKTDANGNVITMTYDADGNIVTKTEAVGRADERTITYTYNGFGEVLTETDNDGNLTSYTYDSNGNTLTKTEATGTADERTTVFTYDANGQVLTITDPNGNITTNIYDQYGNLSSVTNALNHTITYAYDIVGNLISVTDTNGNITSYQYDLKGRLETMTGPGGGAINYEYDNAGNRTALSDANGNRTTYVYDDINRLIRIIDPNGDSTNYTYDTESNITSMTIKDNSDNVITTETYLYNDHNMPTRTTHTDSTYIEQTYDALGNVLTKRDEEDNIHNFSYNALNRLVSVTDPASGITSFSYDSRDNLLTVSDVNSNLTAYTYDNLNRLVSTASPDTGTTTYTYDNNGNILTKTDANGLMTTYTYDELNRRMSIQFPDAAQDIYYYYDDPEATNAKGRLTLIADLSGDTWYDYDSMGRVVKETKKINNILYRTEYTYDLHGNLLTITYPGGRVITYSYNQLNKPISVTDTYLSVTRTLTDNIAYLPFGDMTSMTQGNGLVTTKTYDNRYQLSDLTVGTLKDLSHTRDNVGNITGITDNIEPAKTKSFAYDNLYRLTLAIGQWGTMTYAYDPVGNRTYETTDSGNTTYNYTQNTNKLASATGEKALSFNYDNNGNTTSENTKQFIYNQNQRLTQVTDGGNVLGEYIYNGMGQRAEKWIPSQNKCTIFHHNQNGFIITESSSAGTIRADYVYLNGQPLAKLEGTSVYYYHNDHLGTPMVMTDENATVVWEGEYLPFGEAFSVTGSVTNNLRFPGQYYDEETDMHYNYFRDYKPEIGRYVEADPIGLLGGVNLYAYVGSNPLNYYDSWGLYGSDVHYDLTYKLARQAGYSMKDAVTIASANQGLDEGLSNPFFWPLGSTALHFMSSEEAEIAVEQAIQMNNLKLLGRALHMLQDSYSHAEYNAYPSLELSKNMKFKFGHIQDGHVPDKYCESSKRDTTMRNHTIKYLKSFLGNLK